MELRRAFTRAALVFAASLLVLLVIYGDRLPGPLFVVDDAALIDIPQLRLPWGWTLLRVLLTPGYHVDYYPLRDLSYWFDIHGLGASPDAVDGTVFRAHQIVLLALSAAVLSVLCSWMVSWSVAAAVAFVWTVHPVHQESILWVSARKDLLALLFGLAAVMFGAFGLELSYRSRLRAGLLAASAVSFLLSLASKASLLLLPAVATYWILVSAELRRDRLAWVWMAALAGIAALGLGTQTWFYSTVNDMRFFYPFSTRLEASVTALGRGVAGWILPYVNAIDLENWGAWSSHNRSFIAVGYLGWAALAATGVLAWRRREHRAGLFLMAFVVLYLPISGLLFPHRNFYSVRYFVPLLGLVVVAGVFALARLQAKQWFGVLALFGAVSIGLGMTRLRWDGPLKAAEHAAALSPANVALQRMHLIELQELHRWGRLDAHGTVLMRRVEAQVRAHCDLSAKADALCLSWWSSVVLDRKQSPPARLAALLNHVQLLQQYNPALAIRSDINGRALIALDQPSPPLEPLMEYVATRVDASSEFSRQLRLRSLRELGDVATCRRLFDHWSGLGLLRGSFSTLCERKVET